MGIRFRKSFKVGKGARVNFGKTGASVTFGPRGAHHTIHSSGRRTTSVGIPGTGISYVNTSNPHQNRAMGGNYGNNPYGNGTYGNGPYMNNPYPQPTRPKRKTWLWVLGWIFIFPLPLTILLVRNQQIPKALRTFLIGLAWLIYVPLAFSNTGNRKTPDNTTRTSPATATGTASKESPAGKRAATQSEIAPAEATRTLTIESGKDITVKEGETYSEGLMAIQGDISLQDIVFVNDADEIAEVKGIKQVGFAIRYEVTGLKAGDTVIHAETKDGTVKSEDIHVNVQEIAKVETIKIGLERTELTIGETVTANVSVEPSDAEDKTIKWTSSAPEVARVNPNGVITGISGGTATITATSSNDISDSVDITVNGSTALMNVSSVHHRENDANIGDEWSYGIRINGEPPQKTMSVSVGEEITFSATITESDKDPDVGSASASHIVSEDDIVNGFEVPLELDVTENGGRYSGQSAHFVVIFTYKPATNE